MGKTLPLPLKSSKARQADLCVMSAVIPVPLQRSCQIWFLSFIFFHVFHGFTCRYMESYLALSSIMGSFLRCLHSFPYLWEFRDLLALKHLLIWVPTFYHVEIRGCEIQLCPGPCLQHDLDETLTLSWSICKIRGVTVPRWAHRDVKRLRLHVRTKFISWTTGHQLHLELYRHSARNPSIKAMLFFAVKISSFWFLCLDVETFLIVPQNHDSVHSLSIELYAGWVW